MKYGQIIFMQVLPRYQQEFLVLCKFNMTKIRLEHLININMVNDTQIVYEINVSLGARSLNFTVRIPSTH